MFFFLCVCFVWANSAVLWFTALSLFTPSRFTNHYFPQPRSTVTLRGCVHVAGFKSVDCSYSDVYRMLAYSKMCLYLRVPSGFLGRFSFYCSLHVRGFESWNAVHLSLKLICVYMHLIIFAHLHLAYLALFVVHIRLMFKEKKLTLLGLCECFISGPGMILWEMSL